MRETLMEDKATERPAPARMHTRQREMHPQRLDLNALIVQMGRTFEHIVGKDIAIEVECEQDLPPMLGVSNMVKLALLDLCATARAAMPSGGRLLIRTYVTQVDETRAGRLLETRVGEFVCLEVQHRGVSPTASDASTERDAAASLATVYGIAQQHCGWLDFHRDGREGVSFTIYFPVAAKGGCNEAGDDAAVEIPGGHETILLVEDERDLLELTREFLERYGYRIITAPNGVAALKVWSENQREIDLLLTDMRMPDGINGYELAQRLVSDKPALKVIYVSGYSIEHTPAMRLKEGSNFLTKPYTPPGLAQAVRRMLDCEPIAQAA